MRLGLHSRTFFPLQMMNISIAKALYGESYFNGNGLEGDLLRLLPRTIVTKGGGTNEMGCGLVARAFS